MIVHVIVKLVPTREIKYSIVKLTNLNREINSEINPEINRLI
jgi:hypothetical protein